MQQVKSNTFPSLSPHTYFGAQGKTAGLVQTVIENSSIAVALSIISNFHDTQPTIYDDDTREVDIAVSHVPCGLLFIVEHFVRVPSQWHMSNTEQVQDSILLREVYLSCSHAHELWWLQRDTATFGQLGVVDVQKIL